MCAFVKEPEKNLEVMNEYDVVVAGGGIAGVAAALASVRNGAKTLLLEKEGALGGLATLGLVTTYLPLCDGCGNKVIGGISEELLLLSVRSIKHNNKDTMYQVVPECWKKEATTEERSKNRYVTNFPPAQYELDMEEILLEAGVKILYDTRICSTLLNGGTITHLIIESKGGRQAIGAKSVVDATGDADICWFAGEKTFSLATNIPCGWFYYTIDNEIKLSCNSRNYNDDLSKLDNGDKLFSVDTAQQLTDQIIESRKTIKNNIHEIQQRNPNKDVIATSIPTIATYRATRRLNNEFVLDESMIHTWFDDTVALTGDWRYNGPVYAIPMRAIKADNISNLYTAGRCISSTGRVWDITRAIPTCGVTGEAAGVAAALQCKGITDIKQIQQTIQNSGGILDPDLVRPKVNA